MRWGAVTIGCLFCVLVIACEMRTYNEPQVLSVEEYLGKIRAESDGFVAELVEGTEPNQFKMKLTWPDFGDDIKVSVGRSEEGKKHGEWLGHLFSPNREYLDEKIEAGKTYHYSLSISKKVDLNYLPQDSRSLHIKVYPDYELLPKGDPIPNGRYHRVFFRKDTRLDLTEDLLILADEFIVEPNFQIHYWVEGCGTTIPKPYSIALLTAIASGDNSIQMVNEFVVRGGAPLPSILLESRQGEPFRIADKNFKDHRLCVKTPKLKIWDPTVCNEVSVLLRKKAQ